MKEGADGDWLTVLVFLLFSSVFLFQAIWGLRSGRTLKQPFGRGDADRARDPDMFYISIGWKFLSAGIFLSLSLFFFYVFFLK